MSKQLKKKKHLILWTKKQLKPQKTIAYQMFDFSMCEIELESSCSGRGTPVLPVCFLTPAGFLRVAASVPFALLALQVCYAQFIIDGHS